MMTLTKKEKSIAILSVLLLIVLFVGVYFLYIQPKKTQVETKETELNTEQQMLSVLQNKISQTNSNTFQSTVELQKHVPVKPLLEKLLLDIEKAEVLSNSFVVSMDFGDGEMNVPEEQDLVEEYEDELSGEDEAEVKPESSIPLPTGVKKIQINLTVESPSYFELEKFISTLESTERILVVEKLDFTGQPEVTSLDQENQELVYALSIAAFYMPTLTDLIDQLPQMEVPKPSNKQNPFNSFATLSGNKDSSESEDTSNTEKPSKKRPLIENFITYTVQPGDTLEKISIEFYQSTDYIESIKEDNELVNDSLTVGEIILIRTN
ncbi:LysM peptidoglycan-binding domain-containing protein [Cytobacillus sp. FJAT-54145]|uniref:LysM peptidoglycan-binding domain-containing protein n=1 Tax=Cytobacillus spartinae TaxID=3299023 RepID=A0ABW6KGR6_9BACI